MNRYLYFFKRTLLVLLSILAVIFLITGIIATIFVYGVWRGLEDCAAQNTVRLELTEDRIELDTSEYYVYDDGLTVVEDTWGICSIDGISVDDIVYTQEMLGIRKLLLNRKSEIKDPLYDLECKGFYVKGVSGDFRYARLVKDALRGTAVPSPVSGEKVDFVICLNSEKGLYFKGKLICVEATEERDRTYYVTRVGERSYYVLEDVNGLYEWLDINVFSEAEEEEKLSWDRSLVAEVCLEDRK